MRRRMHPAVRRGVAAVELGFVTMIFVVPLIIAIWEVGRLIHVQQVVANSAREGARLAAQGFTIKTDGTQVQIMRFTGSPNVKDVVCDYLYAAGLTHVTPADVTVTFQFTAPKQFAPNAGTIPAEPYLGEKGQPFTVTVSIPWTKVRWLDIGLIKPTDVHFTVTWRMMIDDAFTINESLPSW
jgi:Flp pilus assembly protein TadG